MHVLSTPPAFVLSQDQTLQTKPNPNPNQPPRRKPETSPGQYNRSRRKNNPEPNPTPPTTPNPAETTTQQRTKHRRTRRHKKHRTEKTTPENPPRTRARTPRTRTGNRAQPDPHHNTAGSQATRTPEPAPQQEGSKTLRRAQAHPPARPPRKGSKPHRRTEPRAPEPPATRHPPQQQEQNERETQKTPEARENTTDKPEQPPKKRETPTHPPKPRTQNMTHYRDLKQHTQPVFGRPLDPLRSGERHPPSYGKRFTAVNLGILDPSHIGGLREAEPAQHSTRSEPSVLDAAGVSLDRSCPGESSRKPHDPGHKTLLRAPGRSARSGPPRDVSSARRGNRFPGVRRGRGRVRPRPPPHPGKSIRTRRSAAPRRPRTRPRGCRRPRG